MSIDGEGQEEAKEETEAKEVWLMIARIYVERWMGDGGRSIERDSGPTSTSLYFSTSCTPCLTAYALGNVPARRLPNRKELGRETLSIRKPNRCDGADRNG